MRFINPKENRRELGHVPQLFRHARVGTVTPACTDKGWIPLTASATTFADLLVQTLNPRHSEDRTLQHPCNLSRPFREAEESAPLHTRYRNARRLMKQFRVYLMSTSHDHVQFSRRSSAASVA